jgi:hypothetical protein
MLHGGWRDFRSLFGCFRPALFTSSTAVLIGAAILCVPRAARAQASSPTTLDLMIGDVELVFARHTNETGFTLGELLDKKLWALARHPFAPETFNHVSDDAKRPPHPGVQVELVTPGDFGVTIHFRW